MEHAIEADSKDVIKNLERISEEVKYYEEAKKELLSVV